MNTYSSNRLNTYNHWAVIVQYFTISECKLLEGMVNIRLVWLMERNNLVCIQLTICREDIPKEEKKTIAISVDLEKTYGAVWRWEILNSLHSLELRDILPDIFQNFLTNWKFSGRVGASHSMLTNKMYKVSYKAVQVVSHALS